MSKWLVSILYLPVLLHSLYIFFRNSSWPLDMRFALVLKKDTRQQRTTWRSVELFFINVMLLWSQFAMFRLSPARARVNWPNTTSLSEISSEKLLGLLLTRGEHKSCSESARRRDAWNSWRKGSDLTTWPRRRGRKCKLSCKPRERSQQLKFKLVEISINKSCRSYFWMQLLSYYGHLSILFCIFESLSYDENPSIITKLLSWTGDINEKSGSKLR